MWNYVHFMFVVKSLIYFTLYVLWACIHIALLNNTWCKIWNINFLNSSYNTFVHFNTFLKFDLEPLQNTIELKTISEFFLQCLQFCFCFQLSFTGDRFVPETYENGYKITMRLTINDVDAQNFGSYRCVAKNSLGDTDGAIKLYRKYFNYHHTLSVRPNDKTF